MNFTQMKSKSVQVSMKLKAISHPQRLMIMCYLAQGEKNVSQITKLCGISQSQMSQFLTRLLKEGLLSMRKENNFCFYSIKDKKMLKLMKAMHAIFC